MAEESKDRGVMESPDAGTEQEEVKAWNSAINRTKQWRDDLGDKQGWKRFIKEYKGNWEFQQQSLDIPVVPVNLPFSWVKTEVSRMYFQNPWITVNAKRVEDIAAAQIAEQVINYMWGEIDLKRQVKLALLDALIVGHGWIKVGYTATFGTNEFKEKRGPGRPKKDTPPVDTNEFVKSENVFAVHYPWTDVLFDPSASWPPHHNARWMAFKWVKPIRAIKDSGLYKDTEKIKPTDLNSVNAKASVDKPLGKDIKVAVGWEIWDRDNEKVLTISEGMDTYLREIPWPEEHKDEEGNPVLPGVMLSFNPIPGEPYPLSDFASFEPIVIELIKANAIQLNHLKRWNRQIFMKPDLMTEENKSNFKQAIDGAIIEVQGNPQTDFYIPPYAPVQQDVYGIITQLSNWYRVISGQTESEQGGPAKTGTRTLGELRMVLQGNHSRAEERVTVLEDFISEIARKILKVIQKKFDIPKIARIIGNKSMSKALMQRPSAQPKPGVPNAPQPYTTDFAFSWNREDIHGDMDVDTLAGSTVPLNKENQLQILEKLLPMLPAIGITPGSPAARQFGREYLRLIDIKSLEPIMDLAEQQPPQPNPLMAKAQLEMQKGQMKMQTDQQKAQFQLQGQQAKTQAEIVKAKAAIQKTQASMQHDVLKSILDQYTTQNGATQNSPIEDM